MTRTHVSVSAVRSLLALGGALAFMPEIAGQNSEPTSSPSVAPLVRQEEAREASIWDLLLLTPIKFYGKVVDLNQNPVGDADVLVSMDSTLAEEKPKVWLKSDSEGLFHVSGHGLGLVVKVSKKGYYHLKASDGNFGYSKAGGDIDPHPDPTKPAIFVLRKMGTPVHLVQLEKIFRVKKESDVHVISLSTGQSVVEGVGDVKVESWIESSGSGASHNLPFNWCFRISVPGGGLVQRNDEFDFLAPADGYQATDEINMPASLGNDWKRQLTRSYFLHLASDRYVRLELLLVPGGNRYFGIRSFINPNPGQRNLEWDQIMDPRY